MEHLPPIAVRENRVKTAIALQEPDRVPFFPSFNNYFCLEYGVSIQAAMTDPMTLSEPIKKFLNRYEPDLFYLPPTFPIAPMETSGYTAARWPGPYYGLPENTPYQYVDKQYLQDEDYDEFLADPTRFVMTKIMPKKHSAYAGIEMIEPFLLCDCAIYSQAPFGLPPVKAALEAMIKTGEQVMENLGKVAALAQQCVAQGYVPMGGAVACAPFDDFADHVRGLLQTCMDCVEEPERLAEALEYWASKSIPAAIANAKRQHANYIVIPLHCGTEEFMSLENYKKFYWPGLKKLIEAAVAADITPMVFCEGKYYTRYEVLADVPKGKVFYFFEDADLVEAKRVLGNVACIGGGMPTEYLMGGSVERVVDQTKRMIDQLAPGGGFIMTNSKCLDHVVTANMEAWKDTLFTYGKY